MHQELLNVYLSCQNHQRESHIGSPLVDFIVGVAQVNYSACEAVVDAGFLDMLLCMYACNFISNLETTVPHGANDTDERLYLVLEACSAALLTLCQQPDVQIRVFAHPIYVLWPESASLLSVFGRRTKERHMKWRQLGPEIAA